jgi:hypothetical protein
LNKPPVRQTDFRKIGNVENFRKGLLDFFPDFDPQDFKDR